MQRIVRITLTFIAGAVATATSGWYGVHGHAHSPDPGGSYTLCFPATQMRGRVSDYRNNFVKNYLQPQKPYGMFEAMIQAQMEPASLDDEKKMGARGPFVFTSSNVLTNDASRLGICAAGPICNSGAFPVSLAGGSYTVIGEMPPILRVHVTNGAALTFDFIGGVPFHIDNPGATPIPFLRSDMYFNTVSLSDSLMQEVLTSPATNTDGALTITVNLDLTGSCDAGHRATLKGLPR